MTMLAYIVSLCLVIYCISIVVLFIQLVGKKKLPWPIVIIEFACIGFFLFLKYLIQKGALDFVGGYSKNDSWEGGLANVLAVTYNLLILCTAFIISQLVIGSIFSMEYKSLNQVNNSDGKK